MGQIAGWNLLISMNTLPFRESKMLKKGGKCTNQVEV